LASNEPEYLERLAEDAWARFQMMTRSTVTGEEEEEGGGGGGEGEEEEGKGVRVPCPFSS